MLSLSQWLAFLAIATFLVLIPGADTVLVIRTAMQRGRGSALVMASGICTGLLIWGAATALGLAALFGSSSLAHDLLSIAGAGYLIFLGLRTLRSYSNPLESEAIRSGSLFLTGFSANLLNPKVAVFYFSIFAQFIKPGSNAVWQGLSLAAVHFLLSMVWFVILTALLARILSDHWRRRISRISGTALIAFGLALLIPVVTTASAATVVGSPQQTNLYSLGAPENDFASMAATANGWVLVGTIPADSTGASWTVPASLGGDDALVASVDATGKPLWATRVGTPLSDAGLLVAVDTSGVIWAVGVTSALVLPSSVAMPPSLDPDGVGVIGDNEGVNGPNQLLISQLTATGQLKSQTVLASNANTSIQPTKILLTPTGATIVGSVATDETGETQGFVATVDSQLQGTIALIGTTNTTIADAVQTADGIQIAGSSADMLGATKPLGIRDAFTATWNGQLTRVIRSGSKGVDRTWSSLTSTPTGFLFVGWSDTNGKMETAVTSLTKVGKVTFSNRYPASNDQLAFAGNRIALTTKTANIAFPGWKPQGTDLLLLSLDAKGKTTALSAIAGPGQEDLTAISGNAVLGRSSGSIAKAIGQGSVILARFAR